LPVSVGTTVLGDAGPLLGAVQLGLGHARDGLVGWRTPSRVRRSTVRASWRGGPATAGWPA